MHLVGLLWLIAKIALVTVVFFALFFWFCQPMRRKEIAFRALVFLAAMAGMLKLFFFR